MPRGTGTNNRALFWISWGAVLNFPLDPWANSTAYELWLKEAGTEYRVLSWFLAAQIVSPAGFLCLQNCLRSVTERGKKEMAIHSSILAWRNPWIGELGWLLSIESHRVGHDWSDLAYVHALEKEMATHSSILAWRIPGAEEPSGLPSMGPHRVGHDWSNLAAAAAAAERDWNWVLAPLGSLEAQTVAYSTGTLDTQDCRQTVAVKGLEP